MTDWEVGKVHIVTPEENREIERQRTAEHRAEYGERYGIDLERAKVDPSEMRRLMRALSVEVVIDRRKRLSERRRAAQFLLWNDGDLDIEIRRLGLEPYHAVGHMPELFGDPFDEDDDEEYVEENERDISRVLPWN